MANKKILISALAGLLAAPVVQAAVDDAGMRYTSAAEGFYGSIRVIYVSNDNDDKNTNNSAVTANESDGGFSRLGIRGSSDLGGGLEATYRWEIGINGSNQDTTAINRTRLATVGLTGGFGTVTFGTQWANDYNHAFGRTDITHATSGNFAPAFRKSGTFNYDSPDFNGLTFSAAVEAVSKDRQEEHLSGILTEGTVAGRSGSHPIGPALIADVDAVAGVAQSQTSAGVITAAVDAVAAEAELPALAANGSRTFTLPAAHNFKDADDNDLAGDDKEDNDIDAYSFGGSYSIRGIDLYAAYRVDVDGGKKVKTTIVPDDATGTGITGNTAHAAHFAVGGNAGYTQKVDRDDVSHFGAGIGYGQDNWSLNYLYITGDNAADTSQDYSAHSLAGQVSVEKLTFRAVYETKETESATRTLTVQNDANGGAADADISASLGRASDEKQDIFTIETQYTLGSKSRVWVAYQNNDQDDNESQKFMIGHRVDF